MASTPENKFHKISKKDHPEQSQIDIFKPLNKEPFTSKEIDILEKNRKFFSANPNHISTMLEIINGESEISIRILEWFVSNYSKKNGTFYKIKVNGAIDFFYVNIEYKNQLNGYSKTYFDPFCRKKKLIYSYKSDSNTGSQPDVIFMSSIGQLNFFKWAIRNKVVHYVKLHIRNIERDMKETTKSNNEAKLSSEKSSDTNNQEQFDPMNYRENIDKVICSSDSIHSVVISPEEKPSEDKSEAKTRRRQLSKSVYDSGMKKTDIPISLDFE